MPNIHPSDPLAPVGGRETPQDVYVHRRKWLKRAAWTGVGLGAIGGGIYAAWSRMRGADAEVVRRGEVADAPPLGHDYLPAERDQRFKYARPETRRAEAARYTNFYEFSRHKWVWRYVDRFEPHPWRITIDGLCRNPLRLDLDQFLDRFARQVRERQYRHRCVETWAMAVPWTGVALRHILREVDPLPQCTHVRFVSFFRPDEAANQSIGGEAYPWPYTEGLTIHEAANELTFLATAIYGEPLLKQHGAPLRLVVPWKYGYKSIKSITHIELIAEQPMSFWTTLNAVAYPFQSNVDPTVARPWNQRFERMLGSDRVYPTRLYNGYQQYVAALYA